MWIAKKDLYKKHQEMDENKYDEACEENGEEINLPCNLTIIQLEDNEDDNDIAAKVIYTSASEAVSNPWYFDSGCS